MFSLADLGAYAEIMMTNLVLSGDNAIVIAMACAALPPTQRMIGTLIGSAGAVVARLAFCFVAAWLFGFPGVKIVGGIALLWISWKLVTEGGDAEHEPKETLMEAVWMIVIADVIMSMDNVIALTAAAHGDFNKLMFGILLSVPIIIFGATMLSKLLERYPMLTIVGSAFLGIVAIETIKDDPLFAPVSTLISQL
jgi:YjbE family integral membrane protein